MFRKFLVGTAAMLLVVAAVPAAHAAKEKFKAELTGGSEVPATDSKGKGEAKLTYDTDTKKLEYHITYSGLSGDAVAAHFHGPADAGANGGVELPITVGKSPIKDSATLTDAQAADLEAGKWYVNVHTAAHPGGEVRGQVTKESK